MPVACRGRANDWPWMAISYNPQLRGKLVFIVRMAFTRSNDELFESDGRVASSELRRPCSQNVVMPRLDRGIQKNLY